MEESSKIALIVATVSLLGSLVGTALGSHFSQSLWQSQASYEQRKMIFEQRIKLLERVSTAVNSVPRAAVVDQLLSAFSAEAQVTIQCQRLSAKTPTKVSKCKELDPLASQSLHQEKVRLNAEFAGAMQLSSIYFGPATRQVISSMPQNVPWYLLPESSFRAVLKAMQSELSNFET